MGSGRTHKRHLVAEVAGAIALPAVLYQQGRSAAKDTATSTPYKPHYVYAL